MQEMRPKTDSVSAVNVRIQQFQQWCRSVVLKSDNVMCIVFRRMLPTKAGKFRKEFLYVHLKFVCSCLLLLMNT